MKQNSISSSISIPKLDRNNYENLFNVYQDQNGYWYYNLLENLYIPPDLGEEYFFYDYSVGDVVYWTYLSYKHYGVIDFWWLLLIINNVTNPFADWESGKRIKILKHEYIETVISSMNENIT